MFKRLLSQSNNLVLAVVAKYHLKIDGLLSVHEPAKKRIHGAKQFKAENLCMNKYLTQTILVN